VRTPLADFFSILLGGTSKPSISKGKKGERERLRVKFFVETGNDPLEFYLLIGLSLRELYPKCPGLDPPHLGFVDPQRPIKPRDIDAALNRGPHDYRQIRSDLTAAGREVQRPTLAFSLPA
jgi:hypothetical protein